MTNISESLRAVRKLVKTGANDSISRAAMKVERLLVATPMAIILDQVRPGDTVVAKAKALGVSRQTYYYWLNGTTRPTKKLAKKIAGLTDFTVEEIRGHVA